MMIALAILYCPGLWTIVHPRAAGFSLSFSLLVVILALAWMRVETGPALSRLRWAIPAALILFALWANLHGGFLAGLLLIAVVVVGLLLDGWRESAPSTRGASPCWPRPGRSPPARCLSPRRSATAHRLPGELRQLGDLAGQLGVAPRLQSLAATSHLAVAAGCCLWLRTRRGSPALTPGSVPAVFLAWAMLALRNIVFGSDRRLPWRCLSGPRQAAADSAAADRLRPRRLGRGGCNLGGRRGPGAERADPRARLMTCARASSACWPHRHLRRHRLLHALALAAGAGRAGRLARTLLRRRAA